MYQAQDFIKAFMQPLRETPTPTWTVGINDIQLTNEKATLELDGYTSETNARTAAQILRELGPEIVEVFKDYYQDAVYTGPAQIGIRTVEGLGNGFVRY